MDQTAHHSRAPEDVIVGVALAATWFVYLLGGLYVLGPVLGVGLTGLLFARYYLGDGGLIVRGVPTLPGGVALLFTQLEGSPRLREKKERDGFNDSQ